jgi:hypothetical protein
MAVMKTKYTAVYDYGMGGLCAVISASSKGEIVEKFPMLEVFDAPPTWMSTAEYDRIAATNSFDIDDDSPDWLKTAMMERRQPQ